MGARFRASRVSVNPRTILCLDVFAAPLEVWAAKLQEAVKTQDIASVILTGDLKDPKAYTSAAKPLVAMVQAMNIAALVVGDTQFVGHTGADGLHVEFHGKAEEELEAIVDALKPDYIVGVGDIRARHDVISAAEYDIDYVLFGNPFGTQAKGNELAKIQEFTSWWAEIMELPCVAIAIDESSANVLQELNPEFIGRFL